MYLQFCRLDTSLKAMQRTSKQRLCYFPGLLGKRQAHDQLRSRGVCAHYVYGDIREITMPDPPIYKARIIGIVVKVAETVGRCTANAMTRRSSPLKYHFKLFF